MGVEAAALIPSYSSINSTLYRERNKRFPGLPKHLSDLRITGKWSNTIGGKSFVLEHDTSQHILVSLN